MAIPTDRDLLEHISNLPHAKANFKQLVREFSLKGDDRSLLDATLTRLTKRGDLIEQKPGHYTISRYTSGFAVGRLSVHRDGYGFLVPDTPIPGVKGDVFLPRDTVASGMHGDRVLVRILRIESDGKADGEITKILSRAHPNIVGTFHARRRGNWVQPHDDRIKQWLLIPEGMEFPETPETKDRIGVSTRKYESAADLDGLIVNVEILEYPEGGDDGVGKVIEILGHPDDFGVDVEIIIRKHHIPHRFPPAVLEQAQSIPNVIPASELERRKDYRSLDIVTIDGETARDFDDAVWVDRLPNGNYKLDVHIADVGFYVPVGSPIDREALERGTSTYFPDRAVPMLPLELSTGICSLNPNVDRLVLSAELEIDHAGDIVGQSFHRGVIRSAERMTYTNVHLLLEGDAGQRDRYSRLVERFELMQELALVLNRKRTRRGSIDFDLPEPIIEFDPEGLMVGVSRAPRNVAHRLIEEFMLSANEAVAGHLEQAGIPSIYRIHEPPDAKRVLDFEEVAKHFGFTLGVGAIPIKRHGMTDRKRDGRKVRKEIVLPDDTKFSISSKHYQKLVAKIEGKPEERILSYLMLRSLKQARYSERNSGHFALAARTYTHFTSPIRRYPDLMVHRILALALDEKPPRWEAPDLNSISDLCSTTERRSAEAERELVEWKKVKFMIDRVGEDFAAMIINTTKYGFFVELEELFIEGLVPIDSLPGDRYNYLENVRQIVGERSRRAFSIGQKLRVVLDRVDGVERRLQFSVFEPEPARKKKHKR